MTEVRDDRLDMIAAIEQAENASERRRANRITRKVATQMTPWQVGTAAVPFGVVIDDISETGVGILHTAELPVDGKFLLTVPRAYHGAIIIECKVVRCEKRSNGLYKIGVAASQRIEHVEQTRDIMRVTSRRTKILFLAFGVIGIAVAALIPL